MGAYNLEGGGMNLLAGGIGGTLGAFLNNGSLFDGCL